MNDDFFRGALCALANIAYWDGATGTAYKEAMTGIGLDDLVRVARKDGQMRISGLSHYLRAELERKP